ncbi:MAG: C13 family peptidase [bacterium]
MYAKRYTPIILLWFSVLLSVSVYAQTSKNTAVVSFVGYDAEEFKLEPKKFKEIFTSEEGAFRVPQKNYFPIEMSANFPAGFTNKVDAAMEKIASSDNPILILAIASHGESGELARKGQSSIKYEVLFKELLKNNLKKYPNTQVLIFLESCYSGSAIPVLKKMFSEYKVSIHTLSDENHSGLGSCFSAALNYLGKQDKYKSAGLGLTPEGYYVLKKIVEESGKGYTKDEYASTDYWSSFEEAKTDNISVSAADIEQDVLGLLHELMKNADRSRYYFLNSENYEINDHYFEKLIEFIKEDTHVYDDKELFKVLYKYYTNAKGDNKDPWFALLTDYYINKLRKIQLDPVPCKQHAYDFINFGYEEDVLAAILIDVKFFLWTSFVGHVAGPKQIDQIIKALNKEEYRWNWIVIRTYNEVKRSQLEILISSIERSSDEIALKNLVRLLLEFDNYSLLYYANDSSHDKGIKTSVNYNKQVAASLDLIINKVGLSSDIKEYAKKALLQLSEKIGPQEEITGTKADARNAVLRFINESDSINDDLALDKFFDAIYEESVSLDGKLSPQTLSVLFRDDVLAYIGQASNPELSILAGITKGMVELEKTNADIAGFKNAKIEEFKKAYEEVRSVVKK